MLGIEIPAASWLAVLSTSWSAGTELLKCLGAGCGVIRLANILCFRALLGRYFEASVLKFEFQVVCVQTPNRDWNTTLPPPPDQFHKLSPSTHLWPKP